MVKLENKTLLVVGAGGFIGGFIAAEGLRRGMDVTVAVRATTSHRYLTDSRLHFLEMDYDDPAASEKAIGESLASQGLKRWDYIIFNLGATKAANFIEFNRVNFEYLRTVCTALTRLDAVPERFLYMSSLSAIGKGDEKGYTPLTTDMVPDPDTRYGLSKIKAEQYLSHMSGMPYIIFRPTGVYGPHEKDYLMMIKSIDSHFDFAVGFRKQMLTFIYVDDLVEAMFDAFSAGVAGKTYIISEDRAYTQKEFRDIVSEALGGKWVVPVKLPMWAVWAVSAVAERIGQLRLKPSTLNRDKFKIMKQRNWCADISEAQRDFGFSPKVDLREGIRRTVAAYLSEKEQKVKQKK